MPSWTFENFLNLVSAILVSIGGAGAIILALSKWFGDTLAKKLLQNHRFKHESELEDIKSRYSTELEYTKAELEKSKALFMRYSEKQFELYNTLWKVLWDLKKKADDLWEHADPKEIPNLSKKVLLAKEAINVNILIIEEVHFEELHRLLSEFEKFSFGKQQLVDLRNKSVYQMEQYGVNEHEVRYVIESNGAIKQQYDELVNKLAKSFREQIKG